MRGGHQAGQISPAWTRQSKRFLGLFFALLCLLRVHPALGQTEGSSPASEVQDMLRDAVAAYDAGDWEEARVLFQAAHAQAPTSRTLRGMGVVAFRQGRWVDAVQLLEASLSSQVKPGAPPQPPVVGADERLAVQRYSVLQNCKLTHSQNCAPHSP